MPKYIIGKFIQYSLVMFLMLTLNFLLPRLMPGNPLRYLAGGEDLMLMTSVEKKALLEKHGLNDPLSTQYLKYLKNTITGNFGYSYQHKRPILDLIQDRLPWTLLLAGLSLIISTIFGVLLGAIAAWKRGTKSDIGILTILMFFGGMPSFWIGMILVSIFAAQLGWFPVFGAEIAWAGYSGWKRFLDVTWHLALPLLSYILISITGSFMMMRYSMLSVLDEDYILMARAKGLKERRIQYHHAMRNALLPVTTQFMLYLGYVFSGAIVIETVFAYPGVGRLLMMAVLGRDYPVIQASFLILTFSLVIANLLADLIYPLLDPRVRG